MSLDTMLTDQIIVIRRSQSDSVDEYNDPIVKDEVLRDRWPALMEQTSSQELTVGEDRVLSDWRVFLPPDASLGHLDRVAHGSSIFEVVGSPERARNRQGPLLTVARLRFVEGG